ncbi:P2X purinoceptor 4-like isoform X1 [Varroa jacobsoni]|uniref:P2X purinoceptor 4-like isoform X1 n=1 Tax=Varroa jacobsoni TaxID=62625 RepID=UPI000BF6ADE6|nr:P2X purinoceptor 4-like isoform X1 [Varroa jacobsoni]XP_022705536.1 P2X purinoceptor 4-like isoform X1 [Varroa jacobsoni]
MDTKRKTCPILVYEDSSPGFVRRMLDALLDYQTLKIINIGDKKIGLLHRLIQLIILVYIVGFVIIYKRGYQQFSTASSATTTKVKGVASTLHLRDSDFDSSVPDTKVYRRVWDVVDLVQPPSEPDAFFITTNLIITTQRTGLCPDENIKDARCHSDADCLDGRRLLLGHGEQSGRCVTTSGFELGKFDRRINGASSWRAEAAFPSEGVCEVRGWCPVEHDIGPLRNNTPLFRDVQDFTVLLKNYVDFPVFRLKLRNIDDLQNRSYLQSCIYHPDRDPHCPKFRVGDIIKQTDNSFDSIAVKGGVVRIVVNWDCNLDWDSRGRKCVPLYTFSRIDDAKANLGRGWNFRHALVHDLTHRTLFKAYGVTFRISVQARAGKLNLIPIAINVGSGLGLLAVRRCHTRLYEIKQAYVIRFPLNRAKRYVRNPSAFVTNVNTDVSGEGRV